jgi:hypothetical protein
VVPEGSLVTCANIFSGLQKMWLVRLLQSQTEDFILFNVQEWGKHGQDEAAIRLQASVPGNCKRVKCTVASIIEPDLFNCFSKTPLAAVTKFRNSSIRAMPRTICD